MERLNKSKNRKNDNPIPTDMHIDGVHFNKEVLTSKRSESARSAGDSSNISDTLKADSKPSNDLKEKEGEIKQSKKEIIKNMEGGYNRNAPINNSHKKKKFSNLRDTPNYKIFTPINIHF